MADNLIFLLDVGQGRLEAIISYCQSLNYIEKENQYVNMMDITMPD